MKAATKLPVPSEAQVQAQILKAAWLLGVVLEPTDAGAHRQASRGRRGGPGLPPGWPDLSGYLPGTKTRMAVPLFVEVKRPGKKPTPIQRERIQKLCEDGCYAAWFCDPIEFTNWLRTLLQHRGES